MKSAIIMTIVSILTAAVCMGASLFPEDEILFKRLIKERKFDEIESRIEELDRELVDIYERRRIPCIFEALADDQEVSTFAIPEWCLKKPNSYIAYTAHGFLYTKIAWVFRGSGYASSVSENDMVHFNRCLNNARKFLEKAYQLNTNFPFSATEMITVVMGQGGSRSEMEKWYQRALSAKTSNPQTYLYKALYLQPKWHGSVEEVLSFAYEIDNPDTPALCVATTYSDIWDEMRNRKDVLLPNKTFLRKTADAYTRLLDEHPKWVISRKRAAFFAVKCGDYNLAAEHFRHIKWTDDDRDLQLWSNSEDYEADRNLAFKMAECNNPELNSDTITNNPNGLETAGAPPAETSP